MTTEGPPIPIEFVTGDAAIRFSLLRKPFPDSDNDWDRDAIDSAVFVQAAPFSGEFTTIMWSHELESLRRLLIRLYGRVGSQASEEFWFRDGAVSMSFVLSGRGTITIKVDVTPNPVEGRTLSFELHADQTYFPIWVDGIDRALTRFPLQIELAQDQLSGPSG